MKYIIWKYTLTRAFLFGAAGMTMAHYKMGLDTLGFWIILLCLIGVQMITGWEDQEIMSGFIREFLEDVAKNINDLTKKKE